MVHLMCDIVQRYMAAKPFSEPSGAADPLSHCLKLAHQFITLRCLNDASTIKLNDNRAVIQATKFISVLCTFHSSGLDSVVSLVDHFILYRCCQYKVSSSQSK